jgi:hypothetical protein
MYDLDKKRIRQSQQPTLAKQQGWTIKVSSTIEPDVSPSSAEAELERRKIINHYFKNNLI